MPKKDDYKAGDTIVHWTHLQHLPDGTVLVSTCNPPQVAIKRSFPELGSFWEVTASTVLTKHHKLHDAMKCPDLIVSYIPEEKK